VSVLWLPGEMVLAVGVVVMGVRRIAHMEELHEWIAQEEGRTGEPGAGGIISVGQWEVTTHPLPKPTTTLTQ